MTAVLQKYHQVILTSLPNATFSLELEGGQLLLDLPVGQTINLFGQDHRLASLSVLPESKQGKTTSDISGPCSSISSRSKRLQQSLVNKLQVQLGTDGSTIYKKTWRNKTTPAQWPYCQLAASAHRTKGKGYSSWPTPNTMDVIDRKSIRPSRAATNRTSGYLTEDILHLNENPRGVPPSGTAASSVEMSAWPTPMTADNRDRGSFDDPSIQRRAKIGKSIELSMLVHSVTSGKEATFYTAETGKPVKYQLNPRFSLWLMGYPTEWAYCAERVTPLSRKSRQK